jgi:hypothetical protein
LEQPFGGDGCEEEIEEALGYAGVFRVGVPVLDVF